MESLIKYLWLLPIPICLILCGYWWYRGEKEKVKKLIVEMILSSEEHYAELSGMEKFDKVLSAIYALIPKYSKIFFTVAQLSKYIEIEYKKIKSFLERRTLVEEKMKKIALSSVNETIKKAISLDYNGDKNLVSNAQLEKINEEVDIIYSKVNNNTNFQIKES